jgi:RecG-like helicase
MKSLLVIAALLLWPSATQAQTLTAAQAKEHEGENATVCGKVASEKTVTSSRGEPTFINLDSAYPNQVFTILVWGDDRKNVGELPRVGSRVCATGQIKDYRGVPEIVIKSSGQFSQ